MKIAMKMSRDQEELDKQKFGGQAQGHMAMMSDTAGFQKVLEMSKREEEERLKKLKTKGEQDYEAALADSLNAAHNKGKHEQAIMDAEEAQLQAALALSEAASKQGQKAESEEEKQFRYILE